MGASHQLVPEALTFVTRIDGSDGSAHLVQFYEDDGFIVDAVTRFIGAGIGAGDAAVVIATKPHLDALEDRLRMQGVDPAVARAHGHYHSFDAADTLSKLMVDGWPDETRFADVVGGIIARGTDGQHLRVRAFGEMVALLWHDGNGAAAIQLEKLWNDLAETLPFSLLCAYPLAGFRSKADGETFLKICSEHSNVIPAESYAVLASVGARLRAITQLQQKATALDAQTAERERAEKSLARSQRELADFFDNATIGCHWVGADGTILRANQAELDLLGYARDEYVGHHIAEFHVDQPVIEDMLQRLKGGETLRNWEARLRCKDGGIRDVLIDSNALFEDGQFVHTRCFTRDVTDRKRAEEERLRLLEAERKARTEAEAATRAKDEFLSIVSHELRTPLAAMLGWVNVLKAGVTGEKAARALDTTEVSGRAQAKLIEDLLDASRVITGQMRLDLRLIDLPSVMQHALDTIRPIADAKGVRIEARLDPSAGPVAGDADRLQQIAWNLLSNALKFTPAGGVVEMRLERGEENVCLIVRDTGRGISREFLPFIFERFRQAESAASRGTGGLGLGLAIARHLVELHGGTVAAASDGEGHGAVFPCTLPLTPLAVEGTRNGRPPRLLDGVRVLVVDDNFDAQDSLRVILEAHGARVTLAGSVREARDILRESPPDALISDIRLPDEDGYALVRELRATDRFHLLPAVAITGYDGEEDAGRALAAGYHIRLRKPVKADALLDALSELMGGQNGEGPAPT